MSILYYIASYIAYASEIMISTSWCWAGPIDSTGEDSVFCFRSASGIEKTKWPASGTENPVRFCQTRNFEQETGQTQTLGKISLVRMWASNLAKLGEPVGRFVMQPDIVKHSGCPSKQSVLHRLRFERRFHLEICLAKTWNWYPASVKNSVFAGFSCFYNNTLLT